VLDIRTIGLTAGIDLAPQADGVGKRGFAGLNSAFHDHDIMLRSVGDRLALTPPLIVSEDQIGEIVDKVGKVIRAVAGDDRWIGPEPFRPDPGRRAGTAAAQADVSPRRRAIPAEASIPSNQQWC